MNKNHGIILQNLIPGSAAILRLGPRKWRVKQRSIGPGQDNNQNGTWLQITNPGKPARIEIQLQWAEFRWMGLREVGYLKHGRTFNTFKGRIDPTSTLYEFDLPSGVSCFGSCPWYANEDADRFLAGLSRHNTLCRVRTIGKSAEGRAIRCLTIERDSGRKNKQNVVVLARLHATEVPGSFAVEATARYLAGGQAPREFLDKYAFHLFPVVNPDGVEHGIKLTRIGPAEKYDIEKGGMTSGDPTIRALREELIRLRPVGLVDHHSYLFKTPLLYVFQRRFGLLLIEKLMNERPVGSLPHCWTLRVEQNLRPGVIRDYCRRRFKTSIVVTELPWQGRTPAEIQRLGVQIFRAAMEALAFTRRR